MGMKVIIVIMAGSIISLFITLLLLPAQKQATLRLTLPFSRHAVWEKAFAVELQAQWRSDIRSVAVVQTGEPRVWREVLKTGGEITLRDKSIDLHNSWTIESVQNSLFSTRWTGEFKEIGGAHTEVRFTEQFQALNLWAKILLFLFINPEKMMRTYVNDLQRELTKQQD